MSKASFRSQRGYSLSRPLDAPPQEEWSSLWANARGSERAPWSVGPYFRPLLPQNELLSSPLRLIHLVVWSIHKLMQTSCSGWILSSVTFQTVKYRFHYR